MERYIAPFIHLTLEMAPYLLFGFFIAGLLHGFVPRRFYGRYLAGRDGRSVMYAALMGVPLPLCSCGVIPTAMSLRRNGASKGATTSFLISTPQTGVDSIVATGAMLGWAMAVVRPVVAFVTGIIGGNLVNALDRDKAEGEAPDQAEQTLRPGFMGRLVDSLRYGFIDMMQDIGRWLVIGLVVAGLITVLVPDNFFDTLGGYPILNMLVVLAIAVPMYVCATGSIPIAVALILKGLTPGAALVFLMAGPATNMASILVINKVLGRRSLVVYLSTIIVCAMAFGLIIDHFVPLGWILPDLHAIHRGVHGYPLWKVISGVLFVALLVYAFIIKKHHNHTHTMETPTATRTYTIKGMMCNHCKANVERTLAALEGVESVAIDLDRGIATITGTATPDVVCAAIATIGYECSAQ